MQTQTGSSRIFNVRIYHTSAFPPRDKATSIYVMNLLSVSSNGTLSKCAQETRYLLHPNSQIYRGRRTRKTLTPMPSHKLAK